MNRHRSLDDETLASPFVRRARGGRAFTRRAIVLSGWLAVAASALPCSSDGSPLPTPTPTGLRAAVTAVEIDEAGKQVPVDLPVRRRIGIDSLIEIKINPLAVVGAAIPSEDSKRLAAQLSLYEKALDWTGAMSDAYARLPLRQTPEGERSALLVNEPGFAKAGAELFGLLDDNRILLGSLVAKINEVLKQADPKKEFEDLTGILSVELSRLNADLDARLAQSGYSVGLAATHYTVAGKNESVRIPGYAEGESCAPTKFDRFNLLPDDRARQEVEFASKLAPFANELLEGRYKEEGKALISEVKALLAEIRSKLASDVFKTLLPKLKAIVAKPNVLVLIARIEKIQAALKQLEDLALKADSEDAAVFLLTIGRTAASLAGSVLETARDLPELIRKVVDEDLPRAKAELDAALQAEASNLLADVKSRFATLAPKLSGLAGRLTDLKSLFDQAQSVRLPALQLLEKASRVNLGGAKRTQVNLQTLCLGRSAGDVVEIVYSLYGPDGKVKEQHEMWLELEVVGYFVETRGFLAFVDPRSRIEGQDGSPPSSFAAAPALGWFLHRGFRDSPFVNDLLRPGVGLSLLALNFKREGALELGIAGSLVFAKDLVHVGYGRNLQAKANFFYIGVNPLALGKLLTERTVSSKGQAAP